MVTTTSPSTTAPDAAAASAAVIVAEDLALSVGRTRVWQGLTFAFPPGLSAVVGRSATGRSSLLLALTGRIGGLSGRLEIAGLDGIARPRRVRMVTAVARISDLIDLEPRLRVSEAVIERALIDGVPTEQAVERLGEREDLLGRRFRREQLIEDLDSYDRTLFAVVLAALRPAEAIVLDDLDAGLTLDDQRRLVVELERLAETGPSVVVSSHDPTPLEGLPTLDLSADRSPSGAVSDDARPEDPAPEDPTPEDPTDSSPAAATSPADGDDHPDPQK